MSIEPLIEHSQIMHNQTETSDHTQKPASRKGAAKARKVYVPLNRKNIAFLLYDHERPMYGTPVKVQFIPKKCSFVNFLLLFIDFDIYYEINRQKFPFLLEAKLYDPDLHRYITIDPFSTPNEVMERFKFENEPTAKPLNIIFNVVDEGKVFNVPYVARLRPKNRVENIFVPEGYLSDILEMKKKDFVTRRLYSYKEVNHYDIYYLEPNPIPTN